MQNTKDYLNPDKIFESSHSQVYRAFDGKNKRPVILKIFSKQYATPEEISAFNREYRITSMFSNEGVIQTYAMTRLNDAPAIVMEDIGGESLSDILKIMKPGHDEFLNLAVRISDIIGNIHRRNIIHKDINPSNIIWNRETDVLRIIDFGIATELPREITSIKNPKALEGTLSYISPEQTGRMNRSLDYRTDFYSLGITFYIMLTGRLPFESKDLMKLVHSHIALQPMPPHEIDKSIPRGISEIIMKLMAKNAEDRYNSAHGLKSDLEQCMAQFRETRTVRIFTLGQNDISYRFQIPQKLYGREEEISTLMSAFERVSENSTELMLVSGFSGIGKSALINEIQKPIVKHRGYFISGKFEKLKKDVPYSGIIQAFTGLARQILAENENEIRAWKEKIASVLGPNGKIITDIIPLFELIIGKQPEVPVLGPIESQNRFRLVLQGFIKTLASREHPLVIFLDDLQWADLASLHLMKLFTTDSDIKHLFMIGAYRNNETPESHPLIQIKDEIRSVGTAVNTIFLQQLNPEHVSQMLNDTLNQPPEKTGQLAEILIHKTGGNPFFINEFLNFLYKEHVIEFSFESGWSWDLTGIGRVQATDNVVDLMAKKITGLPEDSQEILKMGSCIGSYFTLSTLLSICGRQEEEVLQSLSIILQQGILTIVDGIYRFSHDRVLEAAYSLISEEEKALQHYRIGNIELLNTEKEKLHDKIFYIVNHLNSGIDLVREESEKIRLAELNLSAGEKALTSNAYESALKYFMGGIRLLDADCWQKNYNFTLALYQEAVTAAQLSANYKTMEELAEVVFQNAYKFFDKIKVYAAVIFACIARNQLQDGVKTGLFVLRQLGMKLPEKPGKLQILYNLFSLKFVLRGKQVKNLIDLPEMNDPRMLAIMQILNGIGTSTYYAAPDLLPLVVFNAVKLSVKYGNSIYSPYSYAGFGIINCGALGNIHKGYEYGKLALDLVEKFNIKETKSRVWFVVWFVINHWKRPLSDSLDPLLDAYNTGLETGELEFAALTASTYTNNLFFAGKELTEVEKEMSKYIDTIRKFNQDTILTQQLIYHQSVLNLMGKSDDPCVLTGTSYDREKMLPLHKRTEDLSALFLLYYYSLNLNYLFENYAEALKNSELMNSYPNAYVSSPYIPLYHFYDSLTRLALCSSEVKEVRQKYLKQVKQNQKKMKQWASDGPVNYMHKYHLVEAETARVQGNEIRARKHYNLAIELAAKNGFRQEEALALHLAAKFWLQINEEKIAALYMTRARHAYYLWGAAAVVNSIEKKYESLLKIYRENTDMSTRHSDTGSSSSNISDAIDLSTVIKASQTLSSEIDLNSLLQTTMKFSIENAGAQRGFLIIVNEDNKNLYIEAEGESDREYRVVGSIPVENNTYLSSTIVNYVNRTGENVVLDNAWKEGSFTNDPYIKNNKIKSLLCTPVTYKGKTSGILYLENNITTNVFTPDRIELLRILSSQAAISVENARLLIHRENKAKLEKEIEMAERIQRSLLPENIPEFRDVRVAFKYIPMMGVGGDFINIYHRKEDNKIGLFICDVSGHGVYAAMIASMVSNSLDFFWDTYFEKPSLILEKMSDFLKGKMGGNFFTGCICSIDIDKGQLIMANAGHPPMLLLRKNGNTEIKATKGRGGLSVNFLNRILKMLRWLWKTVI